MRSHRLLPNDPLRALPQGSVDRVLLRGFWLPSQRAEGDAEVRRLVPKADDR